MTALPLLSADRRRVGGHVRPRLVDEKDHPQRDADFADFQAVGPHARLDDLPHGVAEHGDFLQRRGDALDAGGGQSQTVDLSVAQAESGGGSQILGVGRQDLIGSLTEQTGGQLEPLVLLGSADQCQFAGRRFGSLRDTQTVSLQVGLRDRGHFHS